MISIEDKQRVLLKGLHLQQRKISKAIFLLNRDYDTMSKDVNQALNEWRLLDANYSDAYGDDWSIAAKLNHNEYKRVKRLREKMLDAVLSDNAIFLTLTFNNDTLAETSFQTRRRYVSRYLKSQSKFYIGNVDYGSDNGREHYHAIVISKSVNFDAWRRFGAINGRKVRPTSKDNHKVSKYVSKLSNHAIKETARQVRLIYSR